MIVYGKKLKKEYSKHIKAKNKPPRKSAVSTKQQRLENWYRMPVPVDGSLKGEGGNEYGIPAMAKLDINMDGVNWIDWNNRYDIMTPQDTAIDTFKEDFHINAFWEHPDRYIETLQKVRAVIAPDYSIYTDMPKALQIYQTYKRLWVARYWQSHGIKVIANICWSIGNIEPWQYAGIPKGTICATSYIINDTDMMQVDKDLKQLVKLLEPKLLFIKCENNRLQRLDRLGIDYIQLLPYRRYKNGKR